MSWYLQSIKDHDTHRGLLARGQVDAVCGIRFRPLTLEWGRTSLPGPPVDPMQVCRDCHARDPR